MNSTDKDAEVGRLMAPADDTITTRPGGPFRTRLFPGRALARPAFYDPRRYAVRAPRIRQRLDGILGEADAGSG